MPIPKPIKKVAKKRNMSNAGFRLSKQQSDAIIVWVAGNRNKLTKIANDPRVNKSPQFVHMVSRGQRKSKDGVIERLLREAGAPIR